MTKTTRRIGLSLGADLCWPICFEEILAQWSPQIEIGGEQVGFEVARLDIEPFDLKQPCQYDIVLDRLTHWYHTSREWIKKSILMDGLYVLNNPWTLQSMEKQTTYCAMMNLGLPVPETWMLPPKEYEPTPDLQPTLERYAKLFDLADIGSKVGYPHFMKPYDGGAWVAVTRVDNDEQLKDAYDKSGRRIMHLQRAVEPFDLFVRCLGIGSEVRFMSYDPAAPLHERYRTDTDFLTDDEKSLLRDMTLTINSFFGWDFNSCEVIRKDGVFYPIDFANACPDSQVTSLHFHFPWLVKTMLQWSVFCAATKRPMRTNLDWHRYHAIRDEKLPYRESLSRYGDIGRECFAAERFEEFRQSHLSELDTITWEYFGTPRAKEVIRAKVETLYPDNEHEEFTELFWERIQDWRRTEST
jgi:hypothetical protein